VVTTYCRDSPGIPAHIVWADATPRSSGPPKQRERGVVRQADAADAYEALAGLAPRGQGTVTRPRVQGRLRVRRVRPSRLVCGRLVEKWGSTTLSAPLRPPFRKRTGLMTEIRWHQKARPVENHDQRENDEYPKHRKAKTRHHNDLAPSRVPWAWHDWRVDQARECNEYESTAHRYDASCVASPKRGAPRPNWRWIAPTVDRGSLATPHSRQDPDSCTGEYDYCQSQKDAHFSQL
jgi:hypothetical protein